MPLVLQPVLADLGAIIQAIILIVFLASGAVKMFRESQEAQKQAERRQQRQRQRPAPGPKQGEAVEARGAAERQTPQEAIRSEVDEFLRRVSQNEGQDRRDSPPARRQPRRPQRQPRVEVLDEDSGFEVDERPRQSRRRQLQPSPPVSPILEPPPTAEGIDRGATVAAHVAEHMKRGEFAERASHMGEDLAQTDERLEARLHEKFDHGLGSLSARRKQREAADLAAKGLAGAPTPAEQLLELLSTPQGVQQAVILSEVLQRPTDRW